jgi:uncharacterized protein (TIGR02266 family)
MTLHNDEAEFTARAVERATGKAGVSITESMRLSGPPGPSAEANRRIKPRYSVNLDVTLFGDHNFYVVLSENLSEGGLFIGTHNILPIGTVLRLEFSLPTCPVPLSVLGEVRWIRAPEAISEDHNNFGSGSAGGIKPGMGIQFKELDPEAARAITKFITVRSPEFYEE